MADKYKSLKVKELQEILQKNGLPHSGKKEELIDRLVKFDERKALESLDDLTGLEEFEETKLDLDSLDPDLKALPEETTKNAVGESPKVEENKTEPVAAATVTAATAENKEEKDSEQPKVVAKPGSKFVYTPISFNKSKTSEAPAKTEAPKTTTETKAQEPKNEVERKLERAKRFNVPLDEKTKMQLRAERFGQVKASSSPSKTPASPVKGLDPEVLKKRAERFGLPVKEAEDEKKRKRAERFGIPNNDKPNTKKQHH